MNKQDRQREQILQHGFKLRRLFGISDIGPVELAKKLHRIEVKVNRHNEAECNGEIDWTDEQDEKYTKSILDSIDKITGFRAKGIPVILNGDPRGYALKIDDKYIRENNIDIHTDWGGYGILAPEFTGNN